MTSLLPERHTAILECVLQNGDDFSISGRITDYAMSLLFDGCVKAVFG